MMSCVNVAHQQPENRVDGDIWVEMPGGDGLDGLPDGVTKTWKILILIMSYSDLM